MKIHIDHIAESDESRVFLTFGGDYDLPKRPRVGDMLPLAGFPSGAQVVEVTDYADGLSAGTNVAVDVSPWSGGSSELEAHVAALCARGWFVGDEGAPPAKVGGRSLFVDPPDPESGWYTDKLDLSWLRKRIEEGWEPFQGDPEQYADYVGEQLSGDEPRVLHMKAMNVVAKETCELRDNVLQYAVYLDIEFTVRGNDAGRYSYSFGARLFSAEAMIAPSGGLEHVIGHPHHTPLETWAQTPVPPKAGPEGTPDET